MREEFEKLVAAGKIGRQHVDPLVRLAEHGYCLHRSWGFGRIKAVDTVFGRFNIDFQGKPNHSMDLGFAAESLQPIPRDHILARKAEELGALRQMAALHHLDLIKLVLRSYGGKATPEQIQQVLVPDIIADDWKKWWESAKHEMRKDGHFQVPMKKTEPILFQEKETPLQDRLMGEFRAAKGLKARLTVAGELLKNLGDLTDSRATVEVAVGMLNTEIVSHQRTMPALALEAVFMREDLRLATGQPAAEGEITEAAIWEQVDNPGRVLEAVAAAKHKRALQSFKAARPDVWSQTVLGFLNNASAKLCTECANQLIAENRLEELKSLLARLISQHAANSELLLWLAKERSDAFADILGPEVFRAMLSAIERDQFNEKKSNRLGDYVLNDQELLVELIESADIEVIKDLTRALQLSPSFDDMDKRSLLARIVKHFPVVQSLISGEHSRQDTSIIVSWASLERRKEEYDELVQKRIPANSRDIAIARSYGDLSENHEYKAAKEMHRLLMRRKSELESQLSRARGTDFANPRVEVASVGTRVAVTDPATGHLESFILLGAWDFNAEQHCISYLSPIAQALLNRKVGEETEFELDGVQRRYRVEAIEPAPADIVSQLATSPSKPASPTGTVLEAVPPSSEPPAAAVPDAGGAGGLVEGPGGIEPPPPSAPADQGPAQG